MTENLDFILQKKESELNILRSRMIELKLQFINETGRFAAKWFEETARQYVTKYSDYTLSLGEKKIAEIKTSVKNLSAESNKIVLSHLSEPNIWWHENPDLHSTLTLYEQLGDKEVGQKFPNILDKPIRHALGELGIILERYGYNVTTGTPHNLYPEFWFYAPENQKAQAIPYFPHLLEWATDMRDTAQKYDELYKQAKSLLSEIQEIKDKKKQQQVIGLWDSTH
jgi:hypothetical protein